MWIMLLPPSLGINTGREQSRTTSLEEQASVNVLFFFVFLVVDIYYEVKIRAFWRMLALVLIDLDILFI